MRNFEYHFLPYVNLAHPSILKEKRQIIWGNILAHILGLFQP